MHTLLALTLAVPPKSSGATATEVAAKELRHLYPEAANEDIHQAIAEAVGRLMTELGPEAFMAANEVAA
jgi:hypothetical protein